MVSTVAVQGGKLAPVAAASYNRARAAGLPPGITSSYRSRAEQTRLYNLWRAGKGNFALPPGSSKHETGFSLDLPGNARTWMRVHGQTFGWYRTNPNEAWHFDYFPERDLRSRGRDPEKSKRMQAALRQNADSYFGADSKRALDLLGQAYNGNYPDPKAVQWVLGVTQDGHPGPVTRAAVPAAVARVQAALGLEADGVWGPRTQAELERFLAENYYTW